MWGLTVHSYPYPCPTAGKYKEQHLVFAAYHQQLEHLEKSAEGFAFDIPMVQKCPIATDVPSIQGVTGHWGGVGVRSEVRHRTLAGATPSREQPQVYVFMYIRNFCPFATDIPI